MLGMNRRDSDDWICDHVRTMGAANMFAQNQTFAGHDLAHAARTWEAWLSRAKAFASVG